MKTTIYQCITCIMSLFFFTTDIMAFNQKSGPDASIAKIEHSFNLLCRAGTFSGAALIAVDGNVLFKKACGQADKSFDVKNNINTQFNLGSVGKLFTSVGIAKLIEEKKLTLNQPVYQLLPSWLTMNKGKTITIGQLLTHTSGLGNFMDDQRWRLGADSGLFNKTNNYKPIIAAEKLPYTPGSSQSYSNSGYLLLGKVIEELTGISYANYINKTIFKKIGMSNTNLSALDDVIPNRAVGYDYSCVKEKCRWKNNYFAAPYLGNAAGGSFSTIGDLFLFSQALYKHQLLNRPTNNKLLSAQIIPAAGHTFHKNISLAEENIDELFTQYGFAGAWNQFGFAIWEDPLLIGHTGGTNGASALFLMSPNNHYTIIILSNISYGTIELYKNIREALGFNPAINNF